MRALKLDCVWWLVTPQNPLKSQSPAGLKERLAQCRKLVDGAPKILVSGIEKDLGTNITHDTIKRLKTLYPAQSFVWISGMDNALSLHQWNRWKELLAMIPMVHLTRKPATSLIRQCPLRLYSKQNHVFIDKSAAWPLVPGTTYWMLQNKMVNISSTDIRENKVINSLI